ncbi:MAG: arylsulfatase [Planctomycetales bacterium]|nr:arylsulfatase [Planctomycetales bacterium]
MFRSLLFAFAVCFVFSLAAHADDVAPPNIVFIMADDLGYGDLGCYGQAVIQTPRIDELARQGRRFTQCYAGSTVCAPSRCVLMTGIDTGHCRVRGNALVPLLPEDVTVAEVLRGVGYETAIFGKWGLGEPDSSGLPTRQGFDHWFGYLNQRHAHNYYPEYLWDGETRYEIAANRDDARQVYSHDLVMQRAVEFLRSGHERPFFLYLPFTLPHANNERSGKTGDGMEVPSYGQYADRDWPSPVRGHAAMISYLDESVGLILDVLKDQGFADNTIVFFTSDNGPHREGGADPNFFHSSGPLRGIKRALYEGGIRVPMIVRWPGHVEADTTSDYPWGFVDFLPTAAQLAGVRPPADITGVSVASALTGPPNTGPEREWLYWEFHEGGFHQALLLDGRWKAVRHGADGAIELYDLTDDLGERHNVAAEHPDLVARFEEQFRRARSESEHWPVKH